MYKYIIVILLLLSGCGGGGGSSGNQNAKNSFLVLEGRATTIPVRLIVAEGLDGVTGSEALDVFEGAKITLESKLPITLELISQEELGNSVPHMQTQTELYNYWKDWAAQRGLLDNHIITVVMVPPYRNESGWTFGGKASGTCTLGRQHSFVLVTAGPWSSTLPREERFTKSAKSLAHELGHILGADHTADHSLMAPALNFEVRPELGLNDDSAAKVRNCLL